MHLFSNSSKNSLPFFSFKIVFIISSTVSLFLSCPHCLFFATSSPTLTPPGLTKQNTHWVYLQIEHFKRLQSLCSCWKPFKTWMNFQTGGKWLFHDMWQKNSQFCVCSVALDHPTYPRSRTPRNSIPMPPPNEGDPPPSLLELWANTSVWMQIFPQTQICWEIHF